MIEKKICSCYTKYRQELRNKSSTSPSSNSIISTNNYPNNQQVKNYWEEITYTSNNFKDSVLWGTKWTNLPNNTLTYTINLGNASSVEIPGYGSVNLINISSSIIDAVNTMMNDLTTFTNLKVENVENDVGNAFISINFLDADNNDFSFLGIAMPPVNSNDSYYDTESQYRNLTDSFWASGNTYLAYQNGQDYTKGSFMYDVMIHELGHSLGLSHPHDNGGNSTIMIGVESPINDFGDYNANLQPITCMSYNDFSSPILSETINGYNSGFMGTFGPLDIEVLQYMYGVNSTYNSGDNTYIFSNITTNKYWTSIYDTGGIDTIDASNANTDTIIDLQNSTITNNTEYAGVKFSYDAFGGFTISKNSSTIENVIGSSQNDDITGNDSDNQIDLTNGGNDTFDGKGGFNTVILTNFNYSDVIFNINSSNGIITITNTKNNDTINLVNVHKIIFSDKEILISNDILEVGTTKLNQNNKTVNLTKTFNNPIVCCGDPSLNGGNPCVVRITNITSNSFTMSLQEPHNLDNKHNFENISYIVGEKGTWSVPNSSNKIIFDDYNSSKTSKNGFETINFPTTFNNVPVVITQIATKNGGDYAMTRTKNINKQSFQCTMQEAEGLDNNHTTESIHWCAFSNGNYSFLNKKFEIKSISNITHRLKTIEYKSNYFNCTPSLLTKCSTFNGSDPANSRNQNFMGFEIKLLEDTTKDKEKKHVAENINYIALENGVYDNMEVGTTKLNQNSKTVNLTKTFNNPIVCCGDPSLNGGNPCVVRITNITSNSFTMSLQEPHNLDNKHNFENISYIVGEKGTWSVPNSSNKIIFDDYNSSKTSKNGFETINFPTTFNNVPVVISQIATKNGGDYVVTRTKNINKQSFQCTMQEAEGLDNKHTTESIHWCAFSNGNYSLSNKKIECKTIGGVNQGLKTIEYNSNYFNCTPSLLTKCSTFNGSDPVNSRNKNLIGFKIKISEDTTKDKETSHVAENINYIAIQ